MQKFAVSFRIDNRLDNYEQNVEAIEVSLQKYMLEPVRITVWQDLTTLYHITDCGGPKIAHLVACILADGSLVYAGPI
jgi:hypothetical protein